MSQKIAKYFTEIGAVRYLAEKLLKDGKTWFDKCGKDAGKNAREMAELVLKHWYEVSDPPRYCSTVYAALKHALPSAADKIKKDLF